MMKVTCSSGKMFGRKEVKKKTVNKMSKSQQDFIRQCPAYGLTPDFYQALCLDTKTGDEYFLEGFSGDYCKLEGDFVDILVSFETVQQMLLDGIEQELNDLQYKAQILLGGDDKRDKKIVSDIRKEINARKHCVQTSKMYANPAMNEIFTKMGISEYPGVRYYGSIYELVSYKPEMGYILENLNRTQYDPRRYTSVSFDTLKDSMREFANELESAKVTDWLQMVENMRPAESETEDNICEGQLFFAF